MFGLTVQLCSAVATRVFAVFVALALFSSPAIGSSEVIAWGVNQYGKKCEVPPGLTDITKITAGWDHTLALRSNGTVAAFGYNAYKQCDVPAGLSNVIDINAGWSHSLALKSDGTVVAWGVNDYGQASVPPGLSDVRWIAGGWNHSLALKADGTVVAWGQNSSGQCNVPAGLSNVVAISGGAWHSLALKTDGTVVAWGDNSSKQSNVPAGLSNVVAIAGGGYHSLAVTADGTVVGWGRNQYGQLNAPAGLSDVVQVAAGWSFSTARKSDGTMVAWGMEKEFGYNLIEIPSYSGKAVDIDTGWNHTVALIQKGLSLKIEPDIFVGGTSTSVTGTVYLEEARPTDTVVTLSSSDPLLRVPSTITIYAGSNETSFEVGSDPVESVVTVVIHAQTQEFNVSTSVSLLAPLALQVEPLSFTGGSSTAVTGTVTLTEAQASDTTVALSSDHAALSGPETITISAGNLQADFSIAHAFVPDDVVAKVTASALGASSNVALTVKSPDVIEGMLLTARKVEGGGWLRGRVTLYRTFEQPIIISLSSTNPALVALPATVTVPAGARFIGFPIQTAEVSSWTVLSITAKTGTSSPVTRQLILTPRISVIALNLPVMEVGGLQSLYGSVSLKEPAPAGGTEVSLACDVPGVILPTTVTVAEGQREASFAFSSADVFDPTLVTVTAAVGNSAVGARVKILPVVPASLNLASASIAAGASTTATVTLRTIAMVDVTVSLTLSVGGADLPATVTIPAGSKSATFTIKAKRVLKPYQTNVRATRHGRTKSATLTITP